MPEDKKGLDNATIALMIGVALFFDALQWLLGWIFMGWLASIFAGLTFYTWFKIRGMSFMKPKRLSVFGGSFIVELIPVVGDILPTWTAAITYLALDSKIKKVVGKIPGGQMAGSVLSHKMGVAQAKSSIREQASEIKTNQPEQLTRRGARPSSPTHDMKEWTNTSNKLSDVQTKNLINKNYKGGAEQYAKDEEKQTADRMRMEEARTKAKNARLAYLEEDKRLNK